MTNNETYLLIYSNLSMFNLAIERRQEKCVLFYGVIWIEKNVESAITTLKYDTLQTNPFRFESFQSEQTDFTKLKSIS